MVKPGALVRFERSDFGGLRWLAKSCDDQPIEPHRFLSPTDLEWAASLVDQELLVSVVQGDGSFAPPVPEKPYVLCSGSKVQSGDLFVHVFVRAPSILDMLGAKRRKTRAEGRR